MNNIINGPEIILFLCYIIATYQISFGYIFDKIKQKPGIKANNTAKLMKCIIKKARYNNFYNVLIYMSIISRLTLLTRVIDDTRRSKNRFKAMLVHNNLQPYITILD